jgi:hypothetical protein
MSQARSLCKIGIHASTLLSLENRSSDRDFWNWSASEGYAGRGLCALRCAGDGGGEGGGGQGQGEEGNGWELHFERLVVLSELVVLCL